jgi:hypothetical protein
MQNACALLYCYLLLLRHCHIFPHYLINGTIFGGGGGENMKYVFSFFLQLTFEMFLILRRNDMIWYDMIYDMIWYDMTCLTAIGLTPGSSSIVHIYTQTIYRRTQSTQTIHRTTQSTQTLHRTTQFTNYEECGPWAAFVRYTLSFALQLRKKHGKSSVRVAGECQLAKSIQKRAYLLIRIYKHNNQNI